MVNAWRTSAIVRSCFPSSPAKLNGQAARMSAVLEQRRELVGHLGEHGIPEPGRVCARPSACFGGSAGLVVDALHRVVDLEDGGLDLQEQA
eukprot:11132526-Alexandrium_andersonii.AAC.1